MYKFHSAKSEGQCEHRQVATMRTILLLELVLALAAVIVSTQPDCEELGFGNLVPLPGIMSIKTNIAVNACTLCKRWGIW